MNKRTSILTRKFAALRHPGSRRHHRLLKRLYNRIDAKNKRLFREDVARTLEAYR